MSTCLLSGTKIAELEAMLQEVWTLGLFADEPTSNTDPTFLEDN